MNDIVLRPIGVINSPFTERSNMPIQPCGARLGCLTGRQESR